VIRHPTSSQRPAARKRPWLRVLVTGVAVIVFLLGGLVAVPVISPNTGAAMADWLRGIIGPEAVAEIESVSFQIQDVINRARYQVSGGQAQISFAEDPSNQRVATPPSKPKVAPDQSKSSQSAMPVANRPLAREPRITAPAITVVTAPSNTDLAWQAFGPTVGGTPVMARASVQPDPTRPYALAALVRIDLSQTQLHLVPGTQEPVSTKNTPKFDRPGMIPANDQSSGLLLAAFNGGFKAIHGHYGMMVGGIALLPPLDNMATIGLYRDGQVAIGAWGRDITAAPDLIAYRQNCPLLVDQGSINPHVNDESRQEWGYTVKNLDTTWRSGLGISKDGRFLIYAVGNSLTVESLANALQEAGAYYAMQLDINGFYTRFVTYTPADNPQAAGHSWVAHKLLNEMSGDPALFLHPYDRDFLYITARPSA
jgi:hypothetical protein